MNVIKLSLRQREHLGINYVEHNDVKLPVLTTISLDEPDYVIEDPKYILDLNKIKLELVKDTETFKGVKCSSADNLYIDESIQEHFTQILHILRQSFTTEGNLVKFGKFTGWKPFTKEYLIDICKKDYCIYLENWGDVGKEFVDKFPEKIDYFIENFCKIV